MKNKILYMLVLAFLIGLATGVANAQFVLSGHVYEGNPPDRSKPLSGVTVELYGSEYANEFGILVASTTTDDDGSFGLDVPADVYAFYNIVEIDPAGYITTGATTVGGTVINYNWIQYDALTDKTLTDNIFYDSPVNNPPVASYDTATTPQGTPVTIDVLANDTDVDGDQLIVAGATQGAHGDVVINADYTVTYTPAVEFYGTDLFTYDAYDGIDGVDTATVTIFVEGGGWPSNQAPMVDAGPDQVLVCPVLPCPVQLAGTAEDPDAGPQPLTFRWNLVSGAGSISHISSLSPVATLNAYGTYVLRLTAFDGALASSDDVTIKVKQSIDDGLWAHYDFDEGEGITVHDSSENNLHGTLIGDPCWLKATPIVLPGPVSSGYALAFDGDDYVSIPGNEVSNITEQITLSAWVHVSWEDGGGATIVAKGDAWGLYAIRGDTDIGFGISVSGEQVSVMPLPLPFPIDWHHVVGTYDGQQIGLYVNGELVAWQHHAGPIATNEDPVTIGGDQFVGLIDEVRIYSEALLGVEVVDFPTAPEDDWDMQAIGDPAQAGSASFDVFTETWTVMGGGKGIGDTSDQFQYVYFPGMGDAQVTARVTIPGIIDPRGKAGLMIRKTLDADSAYAMIAVTPANDVLFQWRETAGGDVTISGGSTPDLNAPVSLRLVHTGGEVKGYYLSNGEWIEQGSVSMVPPSFETTGGFIGLAVTSEAEDHLCTATFDRVYSGYNDVAENP